MWGGFPPDDHNRILLQTNCLLLEQSAAKVLVEAGCGDKWSEKERGIYAIENRTVVDAQKNTTLILRKLTTW